MIGVLLRMAIMRANLRSPVIWPAALSSRKLVKALRRLDPPRVTLIPKSTNVATTSIIVKPARANRRWRVHAEGIKPYSCNLPCSF